MGSLITILVLVLIYVVVSRLVGVFILNIIGLPGSLVGGYCKSKKEAKYFIGVFFSLIGHLYIYLAFVIYLIGWTRSQIHDKGFLNYLVWFFCLVASVGSIQYIHHRAKKEATEFPTGYQNPQILSLLITEFISFVGFFLFVFYPSSIHPLWTWVTKIGYPY